MQKVINILALTSFATSVALIAGSGYALLKRDALIESAKEQVTKEVTKAVTEALPGMVKSAMPSMPSATGDVMTKTNVPSVTGGVLPIK